jgi:hypothetical protein
MSKPRPFADWLAEHRDGRTLQELTEGLATVVSSVLDTGKSGTITLSIKVSKLGRGTSMVQVSDAVKVKAPTPDRDSSVFFSNDAGGLTRNDPYQPSLLTQEPQGRELQLQQPAALTPQVLRAVEPVGEVRD